MPPYERHVFICVNKRPPEDPRGCCADKGGEEIAERFKIGLHKRGLKARIRANKAGCLDQCELGVSVVVYPEGIWYARVTASDVEEIIEKHLVGGAPVERLLSAQRAKH
jgi:(2Fe-2S) ferredoxin